jgi:hypothetical protein
MKGAIMLSGGSGTGKLFAAIGVTYPAGSTLTCTNGSKTLTAKNASGQWVFAIPEAGTWTVTATNGTNTKSQSVSITTEGQFESVTLSYQLVLFSADKGLAEGYTLGAGTITNGQINTQQVGNASGVPTHTIAINETVNVDSYHTMRVQFASITGTYYLVVGLRSTYSRDYEGTNASNCAAAIYEASADKTNLSKSLDISALSGGYYFKVSLANGGAAVSSIVFE